MVDTAETVLLRGAQAMVDTVAAVERSDAATVAGPDWRVSEFPGNERRIAGSLADMGIDEALSADLIVLDASLRGQPRSQLWTARAIQILEQADLDQRAEVERLTADLEHERHLHAERQRHADEKLAEYVAYLQAERQPRSGLPTIVERLGRRFSVVEDKPPVPLAPFSLGETEPRTNPDPRVKAYYAWCDARDAVTSGDELDRRTFKGADGVEILIESWLTERLDYLGRQVGLRQSRLGQLHSHLDLLQTEVAVPQRIFVRDEQGHQEQAAPMPSSFTPRAY
jgi:hypothetical protein